MVKDTQPASEHEPTEIHPHHTLSVAASIISGLTYLGPLLCLLYIVLLGYTYGCPMITDSMYTLAFATGISPDAILAAALLVSSVGLITLGLRFLWEGELQEVDATI
jgi:hypothetical protein